MSKLCDYLPDVLNFMHLRQRSNHRKFCRFRAIMFLGVTKAEQLLSTISNMIPQMGPVLSQEFSAGKKPLRL